MKNFFIGLIVGILVPVSVIYFFHDQIFHTEHLSNLDKELINTIIKNESLKNQETSLPTANNSTVHLNSATGANAFDQGIYERAVSLMQVEGSEAEVIEILEEIINNNPNDEQATSTLSNFLFMKFFGVKEKKDLVISSNLDCIKKFPNNALCNGNLTNIFFDTPRAKEFFDKCLENSPNNSICLSNRGNWYLKKYKYKEAYDAFKFLESILDSDEAGSISIDPKYLFQSIADSAKELNMKKEARNYYDKACGLGLEGACHKLEKLE